MKIASILENQKIEKEMESLLARYVHIPSMLSDSATDKIDKILLHKWLGLPLFLAG